MKRVMILASLFMISLVCANPYSFNLYDYTTSSGSLDYSFLQNYTLDSCPSGYYAYSRLQNGTWLCRIDSSGSGGTVTQINTGTGLLGGPITTTGTISIDQSLLDSLYVNVDGDSMSGNFYWDDSTIWFDEDSNIFMYDLDNEVHHINYDLGELDQLMSNVFLTRLNQYTFQNATGYFIYLNTTTGGNIVVNLAKQDDTTQNYRLDYNNITLQLIEGTNSTPILNRIYIQLVGDTPTWYVSSTDPVSKHAMASRVLLGDDFIYSASLQEDNDNGFLKRVQRRFRKEGLLYESGLNYNATDSYLEIGEGNFINGIYDTVVNGGMNTSNGFYEVLNNGTYVWYSDINDLTNNGQYSSGESFGNNKYINVVFGVTPYNGEGRIYAVVQSKPPTEYTSMTLAYADSSNTLSVYPSEEFLKIFFLPVARVIVNEGSGVVALPTGLYAEDYRGGVAGGVSSGGGLSEVDPVWTLDKPNYVPYTGASSNLDLGENNFSVGGSDLFVDSVSGNVGIGTDNPGVKLDVEGQGRFSSTTYPVLEVERNVGGGNIYAGVKLQRISASPSNGVGIGQYFTAPDSVGTETFAGLFGGRLSTISNGAEIGDLVFIPSYHGDDPYNNDPTMIIRATSTGGDVLIDGNVGIGTTTPSEKLEVNGSILSSNFYASGEEALIGDFAGDNNSGSRPMFIGYYAGGDNTGDFSTGLGSFSGYKNSGYGMTGYGYRTGQENQGIQSTFLGYYAGYQNTKDNVNVAGYEAGYQNKGIGLTGIGYRMGYLNTGDYLTSVGYWGGRQNTASYLTAMGYLAGYANKGSNSVGIGRWALRGNTGNYVVAIGDIAGYNNVDDNVLIIKQNPVNTVPLIYGNFSSGNVGINTKTNVNETLVVNGKVRADDFITTSDRSLKTNIELKDSSNDRKIYSYNLIKEKPIVQETTNIICEEREVIDEEKSGYVEVMKTIVECHNVTSQEIIGVEKYQEDTQWGLMSDEVPSECERNGGVDLYCMVSKLYVENGKQQEEIDKQQEEIDLLKSELCLKGSYSWCLGGISRE